MSTKMNGCFYEEMLSDQAAECIADLFYQPIGYNELCFYCIEGACCPYHKIPQPRVQIWMKEETNAISLDSVLDEIFGLQSICCCQCANHKIEIVKNHQENPAVKSQQSLAENRSSSQSININQDVVSKQAVLKSMLSECHKNQDPTDTPKSKADVEAEVMCEDVEEVFLAPKRRDTLSPVRNDRQKYQRFRNKQYLCDICESSFTLKHNIQTHLLLYHPNNETYTKRRRGKRYRCLKCNMLFRTFAAVQKHQKRQHEVRMRPKCDTCQKEFPTASLLREHVAVIHLNLRPFKCTKCSAVFGRQGCLRRHDMMRHLNYVYICPYKHCTHAGFKCSKALAAHIRSVHTHIRPYKCEKCEKRFVRRNDLRVHLDIHNTECKYACPTCKQMFQRRIHFQKHTRKCHSVMGT